MARGVPTKPNPEAAAELGHPVMHTREDRVHYIAQLMAEWVWNETTTRKLQKELAAAWGCAPATVRDYAAEAHRIIAIPPEDRDVLRKQIAERMKWIYVHAMRDTSNVTNLRDLRSAIEALDRLAKYSGIDVDRETVEQKQAPTRIEIVPYDDDAVGPENTDGVAAAASSQGSPDSA